MDHRHTLLVFFNRYVFCCAQKGLCYAIKNFSSGMSGYPFYPLIPFANRYVRSNNAMGFLPLLHQKASHRICNIYNAFKQIY